MEKEALISVILNDLKEVENLVKAMGSPAKINPAFFKLTAQKIESIKNEIALLEEINNSQPSETKIVVPEPAIESPVIKPEPILNDSLKVEIIDELPIPEVEEVNDSKIVTEDTLIIEEEIISVNVSDSSEIKETSDTQPTQQRTDIKSGSTLGETINKDKTLIADKLSSSINVNNKVLIGKPVDDIKKAIGINDRFLFQRELFSGNESVMNQTLNELNQFSSLSEAETFLKSNFSWDFQHETTDAFMKVVQRKFIS